MKKMCVVPSALLEATRVSAAFLPSTRTHELARAVIAGALHGSAGRGFNGIKRHSSPVNRILAARFAAGGVGDHRRTAQSPKHASWQPLGLARRVRPVSYTHL